MVKHNDSVILGVDVGGSHLSAALVLASGQKVMENTYCKGSVQANAGSHDILGQWIRILNAALSKVGWVQT
jgi:glucokinase